jgi:hypothetical protein
LWHTAVNSVRSRLLCVVVKGLGSIAQVYEPNQVRAGPSTPKRCCSTCISVSWSTVSKAELKSSNTSAHTSPESIVRTMESCTAMKAHFVRAVYGCRSYCLFLRIFRVFRRSFPTACVNFTTVVFILLLCIDWYVTSLDYIRFLSLICVEKLCFLVVGYYQLFR